MKTINTSELSGAALDWAVALCECGDAWRHEDVDPHIYSTDWSQGGPIIEREFIHLHGGTKSNGDSDWCALRVKDDKSACHKGHGPTPLIAAMRCYVASRLGDEVNIPEELL